MQLFLAADAELAVPCALHHALCVLLAPWSPARRCMPAVQLHTPQHWSSLRSKPFDCHRIQPEFALVLQCLHPDPVPRALPHTPLNVFQSCQLTFQELHQRSWQQQTLTSL